MGHIGVRLVRRLPLPCWAGSVGAAGRRLNRAVSVVSCGIANLAAQMRLVLFEREGTGAPVLNGAGEAPPRS